jgi:hypothetical protein
MRLFLEKMATVQMGYTFRRRLDFMDKGTTAVVQMKDLSDEDLVDCSNLMRVDMSGVKTHHLIRPGDIVFRSRGQVNTAAILMEDPGPAVVAAPLIRIRVDAQIVLPAYLTWYINQPVAQAFLASRAKGTAQKMISKQALDNLEVRVPSLRRQHAIVDMANLANEEQRLLKAIAERRRNFISARLAQLTEGE